MSALLQQFLRRVTPANRGWLLVALAEVRRLIIPPNATLVFEVELLGVN